jgi:hypothetical protein
VHDLTLPLPWSLAFCSLAGEPSWSQAKIGGAQTVVNTVDGSLPTGNQVPVVQGDNVFLNEAVRSGADSRAKLVLNELLA